MEKAFTNVTVLNEPLVSRLRAGLKRHKMNQKKFAVMFGIGKMQVTSWVTGQRPIPAKYWSLIERWIATGERPLPEDIERLRKPPGYTCKPITVEELERVGSVCTYEEAASFFGYHPTTFKNLVKDNRDFCEAFNKTAKDKLPIIQVQNMASVGCSLESIAKIYDLNEDQVKRVFDTWGEYQVAFDKGVAEMKMSIVKRQFEIMMLPLGGMNTKSALTAAIYLGKVFLKQDDAPKPDKSAETPTAMVVRWATEQEAADFKDGTVVVLTNETNGED